MEWNDLQRWYSVLRTSFAGTYTASDDPDDVTIDPHNEMSYTDVYPSKVSSLIKYRVHELRMQES